MAVMGGTGESNRELVKDLAPSAFFRFFAEIADIPRASGNCGAMGDYLVAFAEARNLGHVRDAAGNVIVRAKARGTASTSGVILQAHQDMVANKIPGSGHDFARDPIRFVREGDWLRADGTTLGADNGAGLAAILAILDAADLVHPPLEALFTVDEETAMTGALAVRAHQLRGETLINLDSEDYGVALVSSAAGATHSLRLPVLRAGGAEGPLGRVVIGGLKGGHSGTEIARGRANAFVLMARFLADAAARGVGFGLCAFDGGPVPVADNAIPSRAEAVLMFDTERRAEPLGRLASEWETVFRNEYRVADSGIRVSVAAGGGPAPAPIRAKSRDRLLAAIRLMPFGVVRFARDGEAEKKPYRDLLVETSNNLGSARLETDAAILRTLTRGSVRSRLEETTGRIETLAKLVGGALRKENHFPGWETAHPRGRVQRLFADKGWKLVGVHAGLECGVLVEELRRAGRTLDAISVGPDIAGGHTPEERLRIGSVEPFWRDLVATLAEL
ncbi:MAG: beta-Ala-His dipeptidase [Planctomycetota bacterium]|jgi:dipeptidase D|nr:beta-Ala-His dipeptidase [Planctomycetota bacterium]